MPEIIKISERAVLQCINSVETACKELRSTADGMKASLDHLVGICKGNRFDQIKTEVDKKVEGLNAQIQQLHSKTMPKLQEILAWVRRANRA